ncbi:hypothetical protein FHS12_002964 [Nocardioides albus]|uniref:Uncharacterized protein n=1 Tax=Nocardioides albus TaxID=1841 RepID=A0A7W5F9G9_9ACTN|nr:hypothetical protein [Nocardioides albus]
MIRLVIIGPALSYTDMGTTPHDVARRKATA